MGSVAGNELVKNFHIFFCKKFFKFDCCAAKANYISCLKSEVSDNRVCDSSTGWDPFPNTPIAPKIWDPFVTDC